MGDDRADGSSAVEDGGQAAISLMPDVGTDSGPEIKILHKMQNIWMVSWWLFLYEAFCRQTFTIDFNLPRGKKGL